MAESKKDSEEAPLRETWISHHVLRVIMMARALASSLNLKFGVFRTPKITLQASSFPAFPVNTIKWTELFSRGPNSGMPKSEWLPILMSQTRRLSVGVRGL